MVNASHHLSAPKRPQWTQYFVEGSIKTKNKNGYTGHTTIKGGWGDQSDWTIYFCGEFNVDFAEVSSLLMDKYLITPIKPIQVKLMIQWD